MKLFYELHKSRMKEINKLFMIIEYKKNISLTNKITV